MPRTNKAVNAGLAVASQVLKRTKAQRVRGLRRLHDLRVALTKLDIPIGTTYEPGEDGLVFTENVTNRFDMPLVEHLDRYVVIAMDGEESDDYVVVSVKRRVQMESESRSWGQACFVVAIDLDAGHIYKAEWVTTVRLYRPSAREG